MYPQGTQNLEQYNLGYPETVLEGRYRPGHFQGVCQAMYRLLDKVAPHVLFMGQKDFQQCMVVKKLLQEIGSATEMVVAATVREADGLAMSSRNMRLPTADREKAPAIYQTLIYIKQALKKEPWPAIQQQAISMLTEKGFKVDYVELADAETLKLLTGNEQAAGKVALVAAYLQEIRLIDNMIVTG
jgi:pantoate--beta-alanine ligase